MIDVSGKATKQIVSLTFLVRVLGLDSSSNSPSMVFEGMSESGTNVLTA